MPLKIKTLAMLLVITAAFTASAQTVQQMGFSDYYFRNQVNIGKGAAATTNPSAYLEIGKAAGSTKGMLLPRGNKDSVSSPAVGLLFYDLSRNKPTFFDGTSWKDFASIDTANKWASNIYKRADSFFYKKGSSEIFIGTVGSNYTNGFGIKAIVANNIAADTSWTGLQTKLDATRRLDSLRAATLLNAISNQVSSNEGKSFWINSGRLDGFLGVNASQYTTEKLRVSGDTRLEGNLNITGGNFFVSGANSPGLYFDNNTGVSARFQSTIGQVMIGSFSNHPVSFVANANSLLVLVPGTNTIRFPSLGTLQPPSSLVANSPINPISIDANGNLFSNYDFWPRYRDSVNKKPPEFILDRMLGSKYDPLDATKLDTLTIYHVDSTGDHGLGIIDSIDYKALWASYNADLLSGSFNSGTGTITFNRRGGGTLSVTGLSSSYTDEQAQDAIASLIQNGPGISFSYNDASNTLTPTISLSSFTTDNLTQGSTNKYFSNSQVDSRVAAYTGDVTLSGTVFSIGASKVTNSMLAGSIGVSKLNTTGTKSSTTFLRGDSTWAVPPGSFTNNGTTAWTSKMKTLVADTTNSNIYQVAMTTIDMSTFVDGSFVKYDATNNKFIAGTPAGGTGESNYMSSLGGGISVYNNKVGVNLELKSFAASDFDSASNVITIDAALKSAWNAKQSAITVTTTGTSGNATFSSNVLNIPNYTYTLPTASTSTLGGVKVDGTSIQITGGVISAVSSATAWGSIPGTLSSQTDLQNALNLKANDNAVVHLAGSEDISGPKNFSAYVNITSASSGLYVYNTSDQTTNYERARSFWFSNVYTLKTEAGGTGTGRNINISAAGTDMIISAAASGIGFYQFNKGTSAINSTVVGIIPTSLGASSTTQNILYVGGTINQTGTAGYNGIFINPTETATGSGSKNLINASVAGVAKFLVDNAGYVTANAFVKSGGSSSQFLKADGSTDNSTYLSTSNLSADFGYSGGSVFLASNIARLNNSNVWGGKQTFTTTGNAALNVAAAPDIATIQLSDGDIWRSVTDGKFKVRENGVTKDLFGGAVSRPDKEIFIGTGSGYTSSSNFTYNTLLNSFSANAVVYHKTTRFNEFTAQGVGTTPLQIGTVEIDDNSHGVITVPISGFDNNNGDYGAWQLLIPYKKIGGILTVGTVQKIGGAGIGTLVGPTYPSFTAMADITNSSIGVFVYTASSHSFAWKGSYQYTPDLLAF